MKKREEAGEGERMVKEERPLTLALLAISLVAWFADAVVGLGCVLAEGVDVAVVRTLRALVCICTNIRNVSPGGFTKP